MPKEYIGVDPQEWGSIEVSWGRDQAHVQLSVAGPIGWRDDSIEKNPIDLDKGLDWHLQLRHRHEVNKLIRTLRKARDQAFGKDE